MGKDILPLQFQFEKSSFADFEQSHPELTHALKSWHIDQSVRDETTAVASQSPHNRVILSLYLAKYAPEGEKIKEYAVNAMRDYYATLYRNDEHVVPAHVRDEIQSVISDFLIDNKPAFDEFNAQIRAWDSAESSWRYARRNAGDAPDIG